MTTDSNGHELKAFWDRIKFFKKEDFDCKCGCGFDDISLILVAKLDKARGVAGVPFIVNSGCRCEKHNQAIHGSPTSSHMKGLAADIHCIDMVTRIHIMRGLVAAEFMRIIMYPWGFHVDVDIDKPFARLAVMPGEYS